MKISSKSELNDVLKYEANRYHVKMRCPILEITEKQVIWKFQHMLRKTEYHLNCKHIFRYYFYFVRYQRMTVKYGLHIPLNTCGKGLKIMHLGSILINGKAKVGSDCSIHINTAIVAGGVGGGVPQIGDNTVIGIGATILGDIKIPDGCAIGANALVNKSFDEENIGIAGVPAKKISNNGKASWA